jgi:uncharacterized protein YjbJ (UPF0337 family)
MLNQQQIQSNWPKIKAQVLSQWSKLSDTDVEKTHGSIQSLSKLVEEKYGASKKARFNEEFEKICDTVAGTTMTSDKAMKTDYSNKSESSFAPRSGTPRVADTRVNDRIGNEKNLNKDLGKGFNRDLKRDEEGFQTAPDEFNSPQDPTREREDVKFGQKKSNLNGARPQAQDDIDESI